MSLRPAQAQPLPRCAITLATLACLALGTSGTVLGTTPTTMGVTGRLLSTAGPVPDGSYLIAFRLYAQAVGGQTKWTEIAAKIQVSGGRFRHALGVSQPLGVALGGGAIWLGVTAANEPEMTRVKLGSSPFAGRAALASNLACTGCLGLGSLKIDGDLQLGGSALKAKQVVAGSVSAQSVQIGRAHV